MNSNFGTRSSAVAPVETRDELIYLLSRASELEHDLACVYLYAGYSIKSSIEEGGLTEEELNAVRRWKRQLSRVAVEEMLHLAQVSNLLTAVGGTAHFAHPDFPMARSEFPFGLEISLEPLSETLLDRLVCYEMPEDGVLDSASHDEYAAIRKLVDGSSSRGHGVNAARNARPFNVDFRTVGEFYHKIGTAFRAIPENRLFIGNPQTQANPNYLDLPKQLIEVRNATSALRAIDMIIEQGECPTARHPDAHFVAFDTIRREFQRLTQRAMAEGRVFDPVRPMIKNPATRASGNNFRANRITDLFAHELGVLFNDCYNVMLSMLLRFFSHGGETEIELRLLARGTLRIMASVLRPLGEALAKTTAGPEHHNMAAGPVFSFNSLTHLLPHKEAAWVVFLEKLYGLRERLSHLSTEPNVAPEVAEAAAALQSVAEHLTPFIPSQFAVSLPSTSSSSPRPSIFPEPNGPYIVRGLRKLTNAKDEPLAVRPIMALCRCGGSRIKPYCDGTHARIGFESAKSPDRVPDRLDTYHGDGFTVLDNRGTCCHFGNCTNTLPEVFHHEGEPFVTLDGAQISDIENVVRRCPSGALGIVKNVTRDEPEDRGPEIHVATNASYYVRGGIELAHDAQNAGASREHYTLCRCGQSKNKPFCDGSHWYAGFHDADN